MRIEVVRDYYAEKFTAGRLSVDGEKVCDTLEDTDRGLTKEMGDASVKRVKVSGETAIPKGRYSVTLGVVSPRFGGMPYYKDVCGGRLPRLQDVPGFEGVLIHVGKTADNTEGCILVGERAGGGACLVKGKDAFKRLWEKIKDARDVEIEVK